MWKFSFHMILYKINTNTIMSQEILQMIITGLLTFITTGGIGSIFYIKQSRKLKDSEVKASEIANESSTNKEWENICSKKDDDIQKLENKIITLEETIRIKEDKITELNTIKEKAWDETSKCKLKSAEKDRIISEINWYRCEVNGCPYRKPPRKYGTFDFPKDGVVVDNPEEK